MLERKKPFEISYHTGNLYDTDRPSLLDLPHDFFAMLGLQFDFETKSTLAAMANTCKTYNNIFQPFLDEFIINEALHYTAFGNMKRVMDYIYRFPWVIYERKKVRDISGRLLYGTVYQIALGAKDWSLYPDKFREMVEMIEGWMRLWLDGEKEIASQRAEQFPKGWQIAEREREIKDSEALNKIFTAIAQSEKDEDCINAIQTFNDYLRSQNEIKTGYHFNDKLLIEAYELYNSHHEAFGRYRGRKNKLVVLHILKSIQTRMTACLGMAHRNGLWYTAQNPDKLFNGQIINSLDRYLDFRGPAGTAFFYRFVAEDNWSVAYFLHTLSGIDYQHDTCYKYDHGLTSCSRLSEQFMPIFLEYIKLKNQYARVQETKIVEHETLLETIMEKVEAFASSNNKTIDESRRLSIIYNNASAIYKKDVPLEEINWRIEQIEIILKLFDEHKLGLTQYSDPTAGLWQELLLIVREYLDKKCEARFDLDASA